MTVWAYCADGEGQFLVRGEVGRDTEVYNFNDQLV